MNQFSAASTMSTYNTVIRCRGNRSKGWGAPGGPMQGPKRFKIIKNDKNLAIVSSFIASILVECWIFCKETVNWWDGTSLKQNDLCRGPSRGLTLLKMARKKTRTTLYSSVLLLIQQISSRLEIMGASIVGKQIKPGEWYFKHRLITGCFIAHDSWLPWKHISMYSR